MTHFLRKDKKTIVDVEAMSNDLSCVICIDQYSNFLLDHACDVEEKFDLEEIIRDFYDLQEMRGEWFEKIKHTEAPDAFCERKLKAMAVKYNLEYVTD